MSGPLPPTPGDDGNPRRIIFGIAVAFLVVVIS